LDIFEDQLISEFVAFESGFATRSEIGSGSMPVLTVAKEAKDPTPFAFDAAIWNAYVVEGVKPVRKAER
jgi:hypothetical protein